MNPENSKTSDPRRLLLNLSNKINLKRREKYVASSNRQHILYNQKPEYVIQKYQLQHEMKTLNFQVDRFLHWMIKIIWGIPSKKWISDW